MGSMLLLGAGGQGTASAPAAPLLLLLAGHSNTRSYDTTGLDVISPLDTPDAGIQIWNTHTNAWEQYEAGTNSDTWNSGASTPQMWGPEAGFAHAYRAANPSSTVYIVKMGVDSTHLAAGSGDDWSDSSTSECFDDMDGEISAAITALGSTPADSALIMILGERDTSDVGEYTNYGPNLTSFITAVRSDWGDSATKVILTRMPPTVSEWEPGGSTVRSFQARVARDTADVTALDTDSYTLAGDNRHWVAASIKTLGEDAYSAYAGTYPLLPVRFGTMTPDKAAGVTLSNGNLTAAGTGTNSSAVQTVRSDQALFGKCYWEVLVDARNANLIIGMGKSTSPSQFWGQTSDAVGYGATNGFVFKNNAQIQSYATFTTSDRIMVAFDSATGKVWFGKNNVWNGDPAAGTGEASTMSATTTTLYHRLGVTCRRSGDQLTLKMTASDFAYTPPSGFAAI